MLDARKNEVYAALYTFDGAAFSQVMPEMTIPIQGLAEKISRKTLFTGEAAHLYRQEIEKQFGTAALFAPLSAALPSAATVAEVGLDMIENGRQADPDSLAPRYIRRPEAEVAWEKRQTSR